MPDRIEHEGVTITFQERFELQVDFPPESDPADVFERLANVCGLYSPVEMESVDFKFPPTGPRVLLKLKRTKNV